MSDNLLSLIKIDLIKKLQENKKYAIDYFLNVITDIFFLLGIIFVKGYTKKNLIDTDEYFILKLFMWFILTGVIGQNIAEIEREIRMDYLKNLIHQRCSFIAIYLSRVFSTCIELLITVLFPTYLILFATGTRTTLISFQSFIYCLLIVVITAFLCFLFLLIVLHVKRIMAAHGLFSNYLLFFSGFVFLDGNTKLAFLSYINYFLLDNFNMLYVIKLSAYVTVLILGIVFLEKRISFKIHRL